MTNAALLFNDYHPSTRNGGEELVLRHTILGLRERGWRCGLAYEKPGDILDEYVKAGVGCRRFSMQPLKPKRPWTFAASALKQALWAMREGTTLVYTNSYFRSSMGACIAGVARIRGLCHLHLAPPSYLSRQYRWGLHRHQQYVATSRFIAQQWIDMGGLPENRVRVVYNPVDIQRFKPDRNGIGAAVREEHSIPKEANVLGYFGRLVEEKGVDVLLQAAAKLVSSGRDVHVLVAGSDTQNVSLHGRELRPQLERLAGDLDIGERTKFLGFQPDIERLIHAMDIVVVPSVERESFGLVAAEGLACAIPVVASNIGGIPEVMGPDLTELLVEPGNPAELALVLSRLMDAPQKSRRMGEEGRRMIARRFSLSAYVDAIEEILEDTLDERNS